MMIMNTMTMTTRTRKMIINIVMFKFKSKIDNSFKNSVLLIFRVLFSTQACMCRNIILSDSADHTAESQESMAPVIRSYPPLLSEKHLPNQFCMTQRNRVERSSLLSGLGQLSFYPPSATDSPLCRVAKLVTLPVCPHSLMFRTGSWRRGQSSHCCCLLLAL